MFETQRKNKTHLPIHKVNYYVCSNTGAPIPPVAPPPIQLPAASLMGQRARWGSWATLRSASAWVWLIQRLKRVNDAIGIVRKLLKKIEIPVQPYSTTMSLTKVSHKFQVVIPKEVRELLGISKGDILQVYGKNHEIVMKKTDVKKPLSLKNLKGLGKDIWKDIDVEEYIKKERESW